MGERMAVRLLNRRAGRRPDVREEQRRRDLARQLAQVAVAPRRGRTVEKSGDVTASVPAEAEPVSVGNRHVRRVPPALLDERALRIVQQLPRLDRAADVPEPTTHDDLLLGAPRCPGDATTASPPVDETCSQHPGEARHGTADDATVGAIWEELCAPASPLSRPFAGGENGGDRPTRGEPHDRAASPSGVSAGAATPRSPPACCPACRPAGALPPHTLDLTHKQITHDWAASEDGRVARLRFGPAAG